MQTLLVDKPQDKHIPSFTFVPFSKDKVTLILKEEVSLLGDGQDFHALMESVLGVPVKFCTSLNERSLYISIDNGLPVFCNLVKASYREVKLSHPIVSYSLFEEEGNPTNKFITIGTTNKTIYMTIRNELAYSFVIDIPSFNAKESVKNLYISNVSKGPVVFKKTAMLMNGFFEALFKAVLKEPYLFSFVTPHIMGDLINTRLYVFPNNPAFNMMSVDGWVLDVDINEFPSRQIARAYNMKRIHKN